MSFTTVARLGATKARPLFERFLDDGGVTVITGKYGSLKTYAALSLAVSIIRGSHWLGHRAYGHDVNGLWVPRVELGTDLVVPGYDDPVALMTAVETGDFRTPEAERAYDNYRYTDADGHSYYGPENAVGTGEYGVPSVIVPDDWRETVAYIAGEGAEHLEDRLAALDVPADTGALQVSADAVNLTDPDAITEHVRQLRAISASYVVYDTLTRCLGGRSDSERGVVAAAMHNLKRVQAESLADNGVLVIHHPTKDGGADLSGGSELERGADTIWKVTPHNNGTVTFTCRKRRGGEKAVFTPFTVQLRKVGSNAVIERVAAKEAAEVTTTVLDADLIEDAEREAGRELTRAERVELLRTKRKIGKSAAYERLAKLDQQEVEDAA